LATPVGAIPEIIRLFEPSWLSQSAEVDDIADLLRQYLTNTLPEHSPAQLHEQIHRNYRREMVLSEFIEITIGKTTAL